MTTVKVTLDVDIFADVLHAELCKWNHIDGCAYHYSGDSAEREQTIWRTKALKLIDSASVPLTRT